MVYRQLTTEERYQIATLRDQGLTSLQIAAALGRHRCTIAREVKRNATPYDGAYRPSMAVEMTNGRRRRSRRNARYSAAEFAALAVLLRQRWSPTQIVGRLRREGVSVMSHETMYLRIWADRTNGGSLWRYLRGARKRRRKRYGRYDSRGRLAGKKLIAERPAIVERRTRYGDWEIDTVHGRGTACVLTAVERKSGLVRIGKLPRATAQHTTARAVQLLLGEPHAVRTLTADNGTEFHGYRDIERHLGARVYFANPHHAWERGTNENTNGLLRQYLPKGTELRHLTQRRCECIAAHLNHRPRIRLGFLTPHEVYYGSVLPTRRQVASCGKLFGSCPRKRPTG
jgi:IS30 family transposase